MDNNNMNKLNEDKYIGDTRYEKVLEQMQLLGIEDITNYRQEKNGTIVWRLPIKNEWDGKLIEVASFKTGYVRNQNSGYSSYQLNKRYEGEPEYFKDYEWVTKNDGNGDYAKQEWTGKYRAFTTRKCVLIPIEIDRLEYLISYCLKNYYIKRANQVADGEFIPKWKYEAYKDEHGKLANIINKSENPEVKVIINGHRYNVT